VNAFRAVAYFFIVSKPLTDGHFSQWNENRIKKYLATRYNCLSLQPDLKKRRQGRKRKGRKDKGGGVE
jgi:hypothetical protein